MTVNCSPETRETLLGLKLFRGLNEQDLFELLQHAEVMNAAPGDFPIREGEQDHHLFILISGAVQVIKRSTWGYKMLQELGPGECFGEMSLIDCRARSASVRALTNAKLLRIDGDEIAYMPAIAAKMYRNIAIMLSSRLRHANEILALR